MRIVARRTGITIFLSDSLVHLSVCNNIFLWSYTLSDRQAANFDRDVLALS